MFAILLHLIKVLVSYAVLGAAFFLLFGFMSGFAGLLCGIEWILIAALFALHLVACATGPMLWNKEQEERSK